MKSTNRKYKTEKLRKREPTLDSLVKATSLMLKRSQDSDKKELSSPKATVLNKRRRMLTFKPKRTLLNKKRESSTSY